MKKLFWLIIFVVIFICGLFIGFNCHDKKEKEISVVSKHYAYFKQADFYTGIKNPDFVESLDYQVIGGIVSHHFFAEREISKLFSAWREQKPDTLVIIGANHFSVGSADILVSEWLYETPWGTLEVDKEKAEILLSSGFIKNEEVPFVLEHSISTLVGFVKYYLPETKLLPIIIKRDTTSDEIKNLVEILSKFENVLVLASVDFSHHVNLVTAENQDAQTLELIKNFDTEKISLLPPQQLDNPPALIVLLEYLKTKNARQFDFWNTNQARLSGNLVSQDVTSYIFSSFFEE